MLSIPSLDPVEFILVCMPYAHKFYKNIEATEEVVLLDVLEMMDSHGSLDL